MKQRVIKLRESDIFNIVKRVISEQEVGVVPPFPEKDVPDVSRVSSNKMRYGTPESLIKVKGMVERHLSMARTAMEQLTVISGVNPDINGIVPDIEKVIEKFNNLYGDPKVEDGDEE